LTEISAKLHWNSEMSFSVKVGEGREVELNSGQEMGGAFAPIELFLVAVAGCTALDVQWIMSKQRQKVDKFEISIKGRRREEDPRYFEEIQLNYTIGGSNIRKGAVERAIRLSQEKYCSVRAMLNDKVGFSVSYTILNGNDAPQTYAYAAATNP
jgi:putative redox protein